MKTNGVIFDLDGTLLDSMYIWDTIGSDYLRSLGIIPEQGLDEKFKKMSIIEAAQYYKSHYGLLESVEQLVGGVNKMIENMYAREVKLKAGVPQFLEMLKKNSIKMCIATATDKYLVESALKHNKIEQYFCVIVTCSEIGAGKDNPKIFETALKLLGTSKGSTLVFEDALHAVETAKSAQFKVVGVYDKSSFKDTEKIKALCDKYITDFKEYKESWL